MKTITKMFPLLTLFLFVSMAQANERCGNNILPSSPIDKICFNYYLRQLRITNHNSETPMTFPISSYSPRTYSSAGLVVNEYWVKDDERAYYREVYREIEAPKYPGDGEWKLEYVEGVTPNRDSFKYLVSE